ncbi:MAG: hypothetical protein GY830_04055 [Bacteroidetes bacterium]|nr:hypothetical protein [Bacteroidota bacterium]
MLKKHFIILKILITIGLSCTSPNNSDNNIENEKGNEHDNEKEKDNENENNNINNDLDELEKNTQPQPLPKSPNPPINTSTKPKTTTKSETEYQIPNIHDPNKDKNLNNEINKTIDDLFKLFKKGTTNNSFINSIGENKKQIFKKILGKLTKEQIIKQLNKLKFERHYINRSIIKGSKTQKIDYQKAINFLNKNITLKSEGVGFEYQDSSVESENNVLYINPNFANKEIGGGENDEASAQEELFIGLECMILPYKNKLSTISDSLKDNEIAFFSNATKFADLDSVKAYKIDWRKRLAKINEDDLFNSNPDLNKKYEILCIDAPDFRSSNKDNYIDEAFEFAYKKLFVSLLTMKKKYKNEKTIKLIWGNFGTGAFENNAFLMYAAFLIANIIINQYDSNLDIQPIIYPFNKKARDYFDNTLNLIKSSLDNLKKNNKDINVNSTFEEFKSLTQKKGIPLEFGENTA